MNKISIAGLAIATNLFVGSAIGRSPAPKAIAQPVTMNSQPSPTQDLPSSVNLKPASIQGTRGAGAQCRVGAGFLSFFDATKCSSELPLSEGNTRGVRVERSPSPTPIYNNVTSDLPSHTAATIQKVQTRGGDQCLVGAGFLATLDATQCAAAAPDPQANHLRGVRAESRP